MKTAVAFASIAACLALRADLNDGNWIFTVSGGEAMLTGYSGTGPEDLVLPSTVTAAGTNYTVTAIGSNALSGKSWFKTVQIPDSVRRIGSRAFDTCNGLVDVLIPESVTNLADNVFHSCEGITNAVILAQADVIDLGMFPSQSTNFQTLVISGNGNTRLAHSYSSYAKQPRHIRVGGVRELVSYCFNNHPNLEDLVFEGDALEIIGEYAFHGCRFEEAPCFGEASKVKLIKGNAFNGCQNLGSVVVPNSVTNIGGSAFYNCYSLSNATIKANMDAITGDIFGGQTNWVSLAIVGNGATRVGGFRDRTMQNVTLSGVRELSSSAFESCKSLRALEFADDGELKNIANWAFFTCTNLASVVVPPGVTNIGDSAFSLCSSLTNAAIGSGVATIGGGAFNNCKALERVEIPSSVTSVGSGVFSGCESIREVVWHGNDSGVDGRVFSGQTNWVSLAIVGNGATRVGGFRDRTVQNVTLSGVRELSSSAFESCKSLRTLEFADDGELKNIANWAFFSCTNLASVVVPPGVTNIGDSAFSQCSSLTNAVIGSGVATIGGGAFNNCKVLERVEIPPSVTRIGIGVFSGCESIREVVWHGNDSGVDGGVFSGQTNWVSLVIIGNGSTRVSGFGGKIVQNVTLSGVSELSGSSFENCKSLRTLELADDGDLKHIADWAFFTCTNLASVVVPASVTNIGANAFSACNALKSVVFKSAEAPAVGGGAFNNLPSDATFYIYEGATGYDATVYPWNSFSVMTLMDDGSVGQSGAINASVTWSAGVPYQILAPLKVRGSSTVLTIEPGAEVRFAEGASLAVENGGAIEAAGTIESPVVFTSAGATKSAGDWEFIGGNSGRISLSCATVEYGGGKSGAG
ncbi:MAG: leucine-rich repeat domain-containing protein, partial [Kiritimatiellae bacterium]|nr:leucine-rich repeat domain-containing protein [Kiritimatiellia bacterium]